MNPPVTPLQLPAPLLERAAAAVSHVLRQQPQAASRLLPHADKRLRLELGGLQAGLRVDAAGLLQRCDGEQAPDLVLRVDPAELMAGLVAGQGLGMRGVVIAGDAEFAQAMSWLLQHLRWDAEDDLAGLLGDITAHRLARAVADARSHGRRWARQLEHDTRDWLAEAPRALVTRAELAPLAAGIAGLRDALARLDKRIALLRQPRGS